MAKPKTRPAVKPKFPTREQWLQAFIAATRPHFAAAGHPVPDEVRVSLGFTSGGKRGKRIGECWSRSATADRHFEIFLNVTLESDSRIADVLTHELVHAAVGLEAKHGKLFKRCMVAVGLTGKATATVAGAEWHRWADPIIKALGPMPRATLSAGTSNAPPKQSTRLLKLACPECGFTCRTTQKHLDANPDGLRCPSLDCEGGLA